MADEIGSALFKIDIDWGQLNASLTRAEQQFNSWADKIVSNVNTKLSQIQMPALQQAQFGQIIEQQGVQLSPAQQRAATVQAQMQEKLTTEAGARQKQIQETINKQIEADKEKHQAKVAEIEKKGQETRASQQNAFDLRQVAAQQRAGDQTVKAWQTVGTSILSVTNGIGRNIQSLGDGFIHGGQIMATAAYRLALVFAPLELALAAIIKQALEFDKTMNLVFTQLDNYTSQMGAKITKDVLEISTQWGLAADKMAKAMYYLVSSTSIPLDQAKGVLERVGAATVAGGLEDPVQAMKALSIVLNVFQDAVKGAGGEAAYAGHALDVMFEAVRKGRGEFEDFSSSQLGKIFELGKAAGATYEQLMAMYTAATRVTTPSQAATYIENLMKAFAQGDTEAKLKEWGVNMRVFNEELGKVVQVGPIGVLEQIKEKLKGITDPQEKLVQLSKVFNNLREQIGALIALDQLDVIKQWSGEWVNASGAVDRAAQIMNMSVTRQFDLLKNKLTNIGIDGFMEGLKKPLGSLVSLIMDLVDAFGNLSDSVKGQVTMWVGLIAATPAVMLALSALMMVIGSLVSAFGALLTPVGAVVAVLGKMALGNIFGDFNNAVKAADTGLKGLVATLLGLAVQFNLITIQQATSVLEGFGMETEKATSLMVSAKTGVGEFGEKVKEIAEDIENLVDKLQTFLSWLQNIATFSTDWGWVFVTIPAAIAGIIKLTGVVATLQTALLGAAGVSGTAGILGGLLGFGKAGAGLAGAGVTGGGLATIAGLPWAAMIFATIFGVIGSTFSSIKISEVTENAFRPMGESVAKQLLEGMTSALKLGLLTALFGPIGWTGLAIEKIFNLGPKPPTPPKSTSSGYSLENQNFDDMYFSELFQKMESARKSAIQKAVEKLREMDTVTPWGTRGEGELPAATDYDTLLAKATEQGIKDKEKEKAKEDLDEARDAHLKKERNLNESLQDLIDGQTDYEKKAVQDRLDLETNHQEKLKDLRENREDEEKRHQDKLTKLEEQRINIIEGEWDDALQKRVSEIEKSDKAYEKKVRERSEDFGMGQANTLEDFQVSQSYQDKNFYLDIERAKREHQDKVADLQKGHQDRLDDIAQSGRGGEDKENRDFQDKMQKEERDFNEKMEDMNKQYWLKRDQQNVTFQMNQKQKEAEFLVELGRIQQEHQEEITAIKNKNAIRLKEIQTEVDNENIENQRRNQDIDDSIEKEMKAYDRAVVSLNEQIDKKRLGYARDLRNLKEAIDEEIKEYERRRQELIKKIEDTPLIGNMPTTSGKLSGGVSLPLLNKPGQKISYTQGPFGSYTHAKEGTQAIDLAASQGTPIQAMSDSEVVAAGWAGDYGYRVILKDLQTGIETTFAHMEKIMVDVGDKIAGGQQIGTVGSTGNSTGPHLHIFAKKDGSPVSILEIIEALLGYDLIEGGAYDWSARGGKGGMNASEFGIGNTMKNWGAGIEKFIKKLEGAAQDIVDAGKTMKEGTGNAVVTMKETLSNMFKHAFKPFSDFEQIAEDLVKDTKGGKATKWETMRDAGENFIKEIAKKLGWDDKDIKAIWPKFENLIEDWFKDVGKEGKNVDAGKMLDNLKNKIMEWIFNMFGIDVPKAPSVPTVPGAPTGVPTGKPSTFMGIDFSGLMKSTEELMKEFSHMSAVLSDTNRELETFKSVLSDINSSAKNNVTVNIYGDNQDKDTLHASVLEAVKIGLGG